jgi:hypothetical protein
MENKMTIGAGKYDYLATEVREKAQAEGVIVIIWNGNKGQGFSAQFADPVLMRHVPNMLRDVAMQMEIDIGS